MSATKGRGPIGVLRPGRSRRSLARRQRHARRRRAELLLGVLVLATAAALALMASRTQTARPVRLAIHHRPARPVVVPPQAPAYALQTAPPSEQVSVTFGVPLRSGMLFDVDTGAVLWQRDAQEALPIASLTKMMTALIVATHSRPSDQVRITPQAVHFTGSGVGLLPLGKRVPLMSLLYGLLLPSGNDAAIALAQHVAGTRSRFIEMMNQAAAQMGLRCTHFNSVSGVVDSDNYSCAADLAVLAHAVLEQHLLAPIVASRSAVLPFPIKGGKLFLYNNNPLLVEGYPGTDGVKTGYTAASGPCLVAAAKRGRTWLAVVVLHSENTVAQAEKLLNAGFAKLAAGTPQPR